MFPLQTSSLRILNSIRNLPRHHALFHLFLDLEATDSKIELNYRVDQSSLPARFARVKTFQSVYREVIGYS